MPVEDKLSITNHEYLWDLGGEIGPGYVNL